jgi:hypothetical protein
MRILFIVCLIVLCCPAALGYSCVTFRDCPAMACLGSVRICDENLCRPASCVVPAESELGREDVESFEDAVKPYEAGINLSVKTRNPSAVKNSIMGSLGLQNVLFLLIKAIGVFVIGLIGALLVALAWGHGLGRIIVIAVFVILIGVVVVMVFGSGLFFPAASSWERATVDDFVSDGYSVTALGPLQQKYISEHILEGAYAMHTVSDGESGLLILESQDVNTIRGMRLVPLDKGDIVKVDGEEVLRTDLGEVERLVFDESRFVFMVTGPREDVYGIAQDIIRRFPTPPTKSRLFVADRTPPDIQIQSPVFDALTNSSSIRFTVAENETGIDTIKVKDIDGFTAETCSISGMDWECLFAASNLRQGLNHFEVQATDLAGNEARKLHQFIYDDRSVVVRIITPRNPITNDNHITLELSDENSGIDASSVGIKGLSLDDCNVSASSIICSYVAPLNEGDNLLSIDVRDRAGNQEVATYPIIYDRSAPLISVHGFSFDIDEENGLARIEVDGKEYPIARCAQSGITYSCATGEAVRSVRAVDEAGNAASVP